VMRTRDDIEGVPATHFARMLAEGTLFGA